MLLRLFHSTAVGRLSLASIRFATISSTYATFLRAETSVAPIFSGGCFPRSVEIAHSDDDVVPMRYFLARKNHEEGEFICYEMNPAGTRWIHTPSIWHPAI